MEGNKTGDIAPTPEDEKDVRGGAEPKEKLLNSSGHVQEIDRTFSVVSICFMSVLTDNAWGAGGGSLVVSLCEPAKRGSHASCTSDLRSRQIMVAALEFYTVSSPPASSTPS